MHGMVTHLAFDTPEAAEEELVELGRQQASIAEINGFHALFGIRAGPMEVVIVRIFETAEGLGRSLAGPLRPDLAQHFSAQPLRWTGEAKVARTG